jgi:hypothetical protein
LRTSSCTLLTCRHMQTVYTLSTSFFSMHMQSDHSFSCFFSCAVVKSANGISYLGCLFRMGVCTPGSI